MATAEAAKKPSVTLSLMEPLRALAELTVLPLLSPALLSAPRGDGHAVLVLPGFVASDVATTVMRSYLKQLGYRCEAWGLGRNLGDPMLGRDGERLRARIRHVYEDSGGKISLIGWSLGGIMARRMAREHPEMIRQVVSLGSPFTGDPTAIAIRPLYEMLSGEQLSTEAARQRFKRDRVTPGIPATSIYTRTDGITHWRNCLEEVGPLAENIEVHGSHCGLVVNPSVFYALADRLSQPEGKWRPFDGHDKLLKRLLFPTPAVPAPRPPEHEKPRLRLVA